MVFKRRYIVRIIKLLKSESDNLILLFPIFLFEAFKYFESLQYLFHRNHLNLSTNCITLPSHWIEKLSRWHGRIQREVWEVCNLDGFSEASWHPIQNLWPMLSFLHLEIWKMFERLPHIPCDSKGCIWHVRGQLGYTRILLAYIGYFAGMFELCCRYVRAQITV